MEALAQYPRLVTHDPFRRPGWRWLRAQWLVERGMNATRRRDDNSTYEAVCYLRDLKQGNTSKRLIEDHAEVHGAVSLHQEDARIALEVQARLLAGQTAEDIAHLTGVAAEAIDTYERLFFCVRDQLDAKDWVMSEAIYYGPLGDDVPPHAVVLKRLAFHGGPLVIDLILPYLVGGKDLMGPPPDLSTKAGRLDLNARLLVAIELLPNDEKTLWKLQEIALLAREIEQKRRVAPRSAALLARSLEKWLANPQLDMPRYVATDVPETAQHSHSPSLRPTA